ncbi:MAG: hypothetical protein IPG91_19520 [Ideonella sp.]|nr:hypothetical protein [Ideonella sp.]
MRYADYAVTRTKNSILAQRYIMADTGGQGSTFKGYTILGATLTTPARQSRAPINLNGALMSSWTTTSTTGRRSAGRRVDPGATWAQGIMAIHCNAMDMRCPDTASDADMGGITGIECHSDGIGPDHRTSGGTGYGYRQTIRCTARTKETEPTWTKRGTAPINNGATVALDDICLPKDAVALQPYRSGTYFVCTIGGRSGGTDTVLDAATTPRYRDGWTRYGSAAVGTEVGVALILNGDPPTRRAQRGTTATASSSTTIQQTAT